MSPTRFLVHEAVADRFVDDFTQATAALQVGNGLDDGVRMGPLANSRRGDAVEALVADALANGATLRTGGERIGNTGYFFKPTVLTGVPLSARIMNEEPFGPVAFINRFDSPESAIAEANRLPYGLAAYAFTGSSATMQSLRSEVQSGMLSINHLGIALPELPFGGIQDSGYGTEGGSEATEAYLDTRLVTQKN